MIRALLTTLLSLTLASPVAHAYTYWDREVDLSLSENPCLAIQNALYPYLSGKTSNPRIRIHGEGTADWSDYHTARYLSGSATDGAYAYCFMESGSTNFEGVYPVADGTNLGTFRGHIFFDNVRLTLGCTGQDKPLVGWAAGDVYHNGYDGTASNIYAGGGFSAAPPVSGNLSINYANDCDNNDIDPGQLGSLSTTTLTTRSTARIGVFVNGIQRRNMDKLTLNINGVSADNDDFGVVHQATGSIVYGPTRITNTAVGLMLTGFVISDFRGWTITANDYGVLFGSPTDGGSVFSFASCVGGGGYCGIYDRGVSATKFTAGTVEGNVYGELVMFEGGVVNVFNNTYFEADKTMRGHGITIGAGQCDGGTRDDMAGGTAADCPGGSLVCSTGTREYILTRFIGGTVAGDKGCRTGVGNCGSIEALSNWAGTFIGGCANGSSAKVQIQAELLQSTDDAGTSVAFEWASTELTGTNSMPSVDLTGLLRYGSFYWPDYPRLRHGESISIPFAIDDDTWTSGNYIPLAGVATDGVAATDYSAFIPIPWSKAVRYQIHRIDVGAVEAHTTTAGEDQCAFVPVVSNYEQTGLGAATVTSNSLGAGSGIAAGDRLTRAFAPHDSLVLSPTASSPHDTQVGIRVDNGADDNCAELHAKGVLTLLPLE